MHLAPVNKALSIYDNLDNQQTFLCFAAMQNTWMFVLPLQHYSRGFPLRVTCTQRSSFRAEPMWQVFSGGGTHISPLLWPHNNFSPLSWSWSFLSKLRWHLHTVLLHTASRLYGSTAFPFSFYAYFCSFSKSRLAFTLLSCCPPFCFSFLLEMRERERNNWSFNFTLFTDAHLPRYYNLMVPPFPPTVLLPAFLFLIIYPVPYCHCMTYPHSTSFADGDPSLSLSRNTWIMTGRLKFLLLW